jgi:hypothetical protein
MARARAREDLGETYPAVGRLTETHALLARLEIARERLTGDGSADGRKSGFEEWQELKAAIDSHRTPAP